MEISQSDITQGKTKVENRGAFSKTAEQACGWLPTEKGFRNQWLQTFLTGCTVCLGQRATWICNKIILYTHPALSSECQNASSGQKRGENNHDYLTRRGPRSRTPHSSAVAQETQALLGKYRHTMPALQIFFITTVLKNDCI